MSKNWMPDRSDDDLPSPEEERFLKEIGEAIRKSESGTHIVNPKRMKEFLDCAKTMRDLFPGKSVKIEVVYPNHYPSCGVIRVYTKKIALTDTAKFASAAKCSSNYEVYPRVDGKMVLSLMFYGMTVKAKE